MDQPTTTTTAITQQMIDDAVAEFQRRTAQALAATAINGGLTEPNQDDLDVVIARNVSRLDLEAIEDGWLVGLCVDIRDDGSLVVTGLESEQHEEVCGTVAAMARLNTTLHSSIKVRNGMRVYNGLVFKVPNVVLMQQTKGLNGLTWDPWVIMEVAVEKKPTMPGIMETAAARFRLYPTLKRVIVFKFYPPREPALRDHGLVRMPAVAVAFQQHEPNSNLVEVLAAKSFGNAPLEDEAINYLRSGLPGDVHPWNGNLDPRGFCGDFRAVTMTQDLDRFVRTPRDQQPWVVAMAAPDLNFTFDLIQVFCQGLKGWSMDHPGFQRILARSN